MEAAKQPIERGTWLALIAMGIAVFVIANDFSAINVAIPQIESDFKTDVSTSQWVVNAYALTFGVLIVTGGRLADIFGRRLLGYYREERSPPCARMDALRHEFGRLDPVITALTPARLWHHSGTGAAGFVSAQVELLEFCFAWKAELRPTGPARTRVRGQNDRAGRARSRAGERKR